MKGLLVVNWTLTSDLPTHSIGSEIYPLLGVLLGLGLYLDYAYIKGYSQWRRWSCTRAWAATLAAYV
jgi:hypothetical protein